MILETTSLRVYQPHFEGFFSGHELRCLQARVKQHIYPENIGRLSPDYHGSQYVVDNWHAHDLQPPPSGYQWVQVNGDFVQAAIPTGVISSILLAPHRL
ncbi:hypothetical protein DF047_36260 [Burkholderia cenocepacia]|nr:hypothetical protein DF047_36260 [Burkholderia cenocepacia]